jgi:RNA polymerase sigma-70 factor (ECF subfamily)
MAVESLDTLLEKMRVGDAAAAERVLITHEATLRRIVRRHLSRKLRAKFDSLDVVQSVWVRVLGNFRHRGCFIASPAHLRNFLICVTRNCLTDRLRRHRTALERERPATKDMEATIRQPRPSELAQADELWERMLAVCPPEHHELLRLKRQGVPATAIAARTGLHEDSVHRIIRNLARRLAFGENPGSRRTGGGEQ